MNECDHAIGFALVGYIVLQTDITKRSVIQRSLAKRFERNEVRRFAYCPDCGVEIDWNMIERAIRRAK